MGAIGFEFGSDNQATNSAATIAAFGAVNSFGMYVSTSTGNNRISNVANGGITTTGLNSHGIFLTQAGTGNTVSNNSGRIQTAGNGASAMTLSNTSNSLVENISGGALTTSGSGARGIDLSDSSGNTLRNVGNGTSIRTSGTNGYGITVLRGAGGNTVQNADRALIQTSAQFAHGIFLTNAGSGNQISNTNDAIILTSGNSQSHGIWLSNSGSSTVLNDNRARIETRGSLSQGINLSAPSGDTTITNSNNAIISATGASASAVRLSTPTGTNTSTNTITNTSGARMATTGNSGHAILVSGGRVRTHVFNTDGGVITAQGSSAHGIAINQTLGGDSVTNGVGSLIQADGNAGHAISFASNSAGSGVKVTNAGNLRTTGAGGAGVNFQNFGGTIINSGSILTSGSEAHAILVSSDSPHVTNLENTGNISALGVLLGNVSGDAIRDGAGVMHIVSSGVIFGDINTQGGDDTLWLQNGSNTTAQVLMGDGSDTVTIAALADISGVSVFNGGDDQLSADGFVDQLIFDGGTRSINTASILNWEQIRLQNNIDLSLSGSTLKVGSGDTYNGQPLGFNIGAGSTFTPLDTAFTITGDVLNAGTINLQNGRLGDLLTIATDPAQAAGQSGNYRGNNGLLKIDTVLGGDTSATDKLVVQGSTSGTTNLSVINQGGAGAPTVQGIQVVQVQGDSNGVFTLQSDFTTPDNQPAVVAGAYAYTLQKNAANGAADGNWYLRSSLPPKSAPPAPPTQPAPPTPTTPPVPTPGAPSPAPAPPAPEPGTPAATPPPTPSTVFPTVAAQNPAVEPPLTADHPTIEDGGAWVRFEGSEQHNRGDHSTTSQSAETKLWKGQAGLDFAIDTHDAATRLVAAFTAHTGRATSDVQSVHGDGEVRTKSNGFGGTLTWLQKDGFYVDGQASMSWFNSDLNSTTTRQKIVSNNDGKGYALSVEGGKKVKVDELHTLTPQIQLAYSRVKFDSFTEPFGSQVDLDKADSLRARLGVSFDRHELWLDALGKARRSHLYGIVNLYHELGSGSSVQLANVSFDNRPQRTWVGIGLGGSFNWNNDRASLYGELGADTNLGGDGSHATVLKGTVGVRVKW